VAAQVKVRVCGLGLLSPRLNGGPVCDDSAYEVGMLKCGAIHVNLITFSIYLYRGSCISESVLQTSPSTGALKMTDMKMTDQIAGRENAGHEIARHDKYLFIVVSTSPCSFSSIVENVM